MIRLQDKMNNHFHIEFANRPEIGLLVWRSGRYRSEDEGFEEIYFDFSSTLTVAALMLSGWHWRSAAMQVDHGLVYAVPFVPGYEPALPERANEDGRLLICKVKLQDGSMWSIVGDSDVRTIGRQGSIGDCRYGMSRTEGLFRAPGEFMDRIGELITVVSDDPAEAEPVEMAH